MDKNAGIDKRSIEDYARSIHARVFYTSAKTGEGLADLNDLLEKLLAEEQIYVERLFPYQEAGKIQLIREYGQLISEEYTEEGIDVKARVPKEIYARVV